MKRLTLLPVVVWALLVCCAPCARAEDVWLSVRSQNFLLVGNASEKEIRRVGTRLEQFRAVLVRLFPQAGAQAPTTVVVFRSDADFRPFKPLYQGRLQEHVAGYFQPGDDINYIALAAEAHGALSPFGVIFHEYTHLVVNSSLSEPPVWFNEGLAEYYSTFASDGGGRFTTGRPVVAHMQLLQRQSIDLAALLRVTHDSPAYNERDKSNAFYAQAWALVHYLLQSDGGQRVAELARYSELRAAGETFEESFRQAFKVDISTVERDLRRYVLRDSYRSVTYTAAAPLASAAQMQTRRLSEAETHAYLGDLLYHNNRLDAAEAHLQQALARAPDLAAAHAALGMVRLRARRYAEAIKELRQAAGADPQDYRAHYYLAEALSRQSLGPNNAIVRYPAATAAAMRAALKRAIELNPNFAEAYHLLAFLDMVNQEDLAEATTLLVRARQLRPERLHYAVTLAQIYMRREEFTAAREVLEQVLRSPNADARTRTDARYARATVDDYAAQLARVRAANADAPRPAAQETNAQAAEDAPPPDVFTLRVPRRAQGPFVRGLLTQIECAGGASVVFHVQTAGRLYKFHADEFRRVRLTAYVPGWAGTSITCGPINKQLYAVLTYRPAAQTHARYDGEALAVELVTQEMEVEPE